MATAAAPAHTHNQNVHHKQSAVDRNTGMFRAAFLSPLMFFIGAICWCVGAAVNTYTPRTAGIAIRFAERKFDAASSLFLIGSAFFFFSAVVSLLAAYAEAAVLKVGDRTPGLARVQILAAWLELIGAACLVVGSALYLAPHDDLDLDKSSAGTILWLIGSAFYTFAFLLHTVIALVVAAVTALMPEMLHRQRAWFGIASTIIKTAGWVVFAIGAAAFVILVTPGFILFGSLLWLGATALWIFASLIRMFGTWYYHVPVMSFAVASAAVSSIVAGTVAQPGLTTGVHNTAAAPAHTEVKVTDSTTHAVVTQPAAPVAPVATTAT